MGDAVRLAPESVHPAGGVRFEPPVGAGVGPAEGDLSGVGGAGVEATTGPATSVAAGSETGVDWGVGAGDGLGDEPVGGPCGSSGASVGGTTGSLASGLGVAALVGSVEPAVDAGTVAAAVTAASGPGTLSEEHAATTRAVTISINTMVDRAFGNGKTICGINNRRQIFDVLGA